LFYVEFVASVASVETEKPLRVKSYPLPDWRWMAVVRQRCHLHFMGHSPVKRAKLPAWRRREKIMRARSIDFYGEKAKPFAAAIVAVKLLLPIYMVRLH
jgi:hypothetical protein